jgi:hypothetical protein
MIVIKVKYSRISDIFGGDSMRYAAGAEYNGKSAVDNKLIYPDGTDGSGNKSYLEENISVLSLFNHCLIVLNCHKLMAFVLSYGFCTAPSKQSLDSLFLCSGSPRRFHG